MIIEICTDSYQGALLAQQYKAKRIELCSALSVGGLTPSPYLTTVCSKLPDLETHVMIRPREGDFNYTDQEIEIMLHEIKQQAEFGAKGVVFGCLKENRSVDIQNCITLVEEAKNRKLECTFHRAFDFAQDFEASLESLINIGFNRLLTSGGKPTAIEGIENIRRLKGQANDQIEIMAGSGINATNAKELEAIQIDALHFTSHSLTPYELGMGSKTVMNANKIKSISALFR